MQAQTVIIVVKNDSIVPSRRQVMVGKFGPGIAKILVDELFAARAIDTECETTELAPQSVRVG